MAIHVLQVPYDSGHRDRRMGHGPIHLLERGVIECLQRIDGEIQLTPVEVAASFPTEIGTAFELHRTVAHVVATTVQGGGLPLVLSGNCNSAIGTVAGLYAAHPGTPVGIIWFDGHGDCNTPETFTGDFLDAHGFEYPHRSLLAGPHSHRIGISLHSRRTCGAHRGARSR